jgi:hypothetical protein
MFELIVVDFSETDVCGELCGASDVSIFSLSVLLSSEHHKQFVKLVNGHCCYLKYCHALNIIESTPCHGREWNSVSVILVDDIIYIVNQNSI